MSRLFNQTRKANDFAVRGAVTEDPEVARVLETMKDPEPRVVDTQRNRFQDCRKVEFSSPIGKPLVLNEKVSRALPGEAYRGLRTRIMRLQARQGLKSVVISSTLPGEGKTLTTMNLALSFASLFDVSVLVVDADLRTCGLTELMGGVPGPGLAEILSGSAKFDEAVVSTSVPNLYAVPAGALKGSAPELLASAYWKQFMTWAHEAFKVVLVDAPSVLPLADFDLISSVCDGILVVVRAQHTRRDALRKVAAQLDPNKVLGVIYNGTENANHRGHERYFSEEQKR
jgi:protein-tyrosine kinase